MEISQQIPFTQIISGVKHIGLHMISELEKGVTPVEKDDHSPVTHVDKMAHREISALLTQLTPNIPIVSEEGTDAERMAASSSRVKWIVDPLDGTNTAISYAKGNKHMDSFGVHVALVVDGNPLLGIAHFPALEGGKGVTYYTADGKEAFKEVAGGEPQKISVSTPTQDFAQRKLRASVHFKPERRPQQVLGRDYEAVPGVGGQRICLAAEGAADIADMDDIPLAQQKTHGYKQWDVAAGHAILRAAGGELIAASTKQPIRYDTPNMMIAGAYGAGHEMLAELGMQPREARRFGTSL